MKNNLQWVLKAVEQENTYYRNMEHLTKETVYTKEEFEEDIQDGFIVDITQGTYNGATQTFQPRVLDKYNVYDAILTYLYETEFSDIDYLFEENENLDDPDMVEELLYTVDLFTVGDNIYLYRG